MIVLHASGTFNALRAAERLLAAAGFSLGQGSAGQPTAFMFGDYRVAKWKNLSARERAEAHGVMKGDRRNGPLRLVLTGHCPAEGREAFIAAASELEGVS